MVMVHKKINKEEVSLLLKEGEGLFLEFKEKYSSKIVQDIVAFANAQGGNIFLGVKDDGTIVGEHFSNKLKAEIIDLARNCDPPIYVTVDRIDSMVVVNIPEGDEPPYQCSSGYYKRLDGLSQKLKTQEVKKFFSDFKSRCFDRSPAEDCEIADISLDKVSSFVSTAGMNLLVSDHNLSEFLNGIGVMKNGVINNAAAIMFGKDVKKHVFHIEMICVAFKDENRVHIFDRQDIRDDLVTQMNGAINFLKKHLNVRSEIKGVIREDIYEIPLSVIREVVANAIIHRNYNITGTSINVEVYPHKIRIVNPGRLLGAVTIEDLGTRIVSARRNDIIADLFGRMRVVERVGTGLKRIQEQLKEAGNQLAIFNEIGHKEFFEVEIVRPKKFRKLRGDFGGIVSTKTSQKTSQKIVNLLTVSPKASIAELSSMLGISDRAVKYQLESLKRQKILKRIGPDNGGHWEVSMLKKRKSREKKE